MRQQKRRVGLYGGTFNPIHNAHLQLAAFALEEAHLERIFFLPAALPPHKQEQKITALAHRFAMIELACRDWEKLSCSAVEGELPFPSYTVDTLRHLQGFYSVETELFFLMGSDALLDIINWKSYKEILSRVSLLMCTRSGDDPEQLREMLEQLKYEEVDQIWRSQENGKDIVFLQGQPDGISSTEIRNLLQENKSSVKHYLPPGVYSYIREHDLYQAN